VNKLDQAQLIAATTRFRTEFEPILARGRQEVLRLQQVSSGATLEDAWALRQEAGKAQEKIRFRIGRIFGTMALEPNTLGRFLQEYLEARPDLIQSIEALWQGFPDILQVIPDCESSLAPAYFDTFCGKLESAVEQINQELLRVERSPPNTQSKDARLLLNQVISTKDELRTVILKATHTHSEVFWKDSPSWSLLERLLHGRPDIFERLRNLRDTLSLIHKQVSSLREEIRNTQTPVPISRGRRTRL
jgi:hypothetical protein